MAEQTRKIQFENQQNPNSHFDIIRLEELFVRSDLDHSPEVLHRVGFYVVLFVESGRGFHTIDFTDYSCTAGTLITIRKDQIHKFFKTGNLRGSLLLFTDDFLVSYLEETQVQQAMVLFNELLANPKISLESADKQRVEGLLARMNEEYFEVADEHSASIIRSELHILLTLLFRIKARAAAIDLGKKYLKEFAQFQALVEARCTQTTKVKDYAKWMGLSTKTLNAVTHNNVHKSAKAFIDDICMVQIKRLLINTDMSVKEIAYQAGFEETTNFYKYFKRGADATPEQFRASY